MNVYITREAFTTSMHYELRDAGVDIYNYLCREICRFLETTKINKNTI